MGYYIEVKDGSKEEFIKGYSIIPGELLRWDGIHRLNRPTRWNKILKDCAIPVVHVNSFKFDCLAVCYSYDEFSEFVGDDRDCLRVRTLYAVSMDNLLKLISDGRIDKQVLSHLKNITGKPEDPIGDNARNLIQELSKSM